MTTSNKLISMRSHIESSLYGARGYFRNSNLIIDTPISSKMRDNATLLNNAVAKAYRNASPHAEFATASSLFRHQYASAVNAWCQKRQIGTIVEVGGGSGALACDILTSNASIAHYHHVEISPELAQLQRTAVAASGHSARHRVHAQSFFDWSWRAAANQGNVALLAFEVFDNLACEKLVVLPDGKSMQAFVEMRADGSRHEVFRDVTDDVVKRCLKLWLETNAPPANLPNGFVLWLPSRIFEFVELVKQKAGPGVSILIADFDELPPTELIGVNAPIVQRNAISKGGLDTVETFGNLLRAPMGQVDILFPTSFEFVRRCFGADYDLVVEKHSDYLATFAPEMPKSMREFYGNMSVLRSR